MLLTSHYALRSTRYLRNHWRRWLLAVLLLVFPFFFIGGAGYYDPRSVKELWNLGHFPYFAGLVVALDIYWCKTGRSFIFRLLATSCILLFVGVGIELIQYNIANRSCSLGDVVRDLSGGAAVLLFRACRRPPRLRAFLTGLSLTLIVVYNLAPLAAALADEYRMYQDFPLLAGFERNGELSRWKAQADLGRAATHQVQGAFSGKLVFTTDTYSGVMLEYFHHNWSGKSGLVFDVFNPGPRLVLHYRIHDALHNERGQKYTDRYNGRSDLLSGWNEIRISMTDIINAPEGRKMDLTRISGFEIFVMRQKDRRVLYLDNVRLY